MLGHAGERVMSQIMPGGFHHGRQSIRVVDVLENEGRGLNLTAEVRDESRRTIVGTGAINGRVTDTSQALMPGVTVTLTSPSQMGTRTAVTDSDGLYRFTAVTPGPLFSG